MQYSSRSDFQFIKKDIFCFIKCNYICFVNLSNLEKKYFGVISNDNADINRKYEIEEIKFCENRKEEEGKEGSNNVDKKTNEIIIKIEENCNKKINNLYNIHKFICDENSKSLIIVLNKNNEHLLYHLLFNENDNLESFKINFIKKFDSAIKCIELTQEYIFVLVKKKINNIHNRAGTKTCAATNQSGYQYGEGSNEISKGVFEYSLQIFETENKNSGKRKAIKKVLISSSSLKLKKLVICPYDNSKIVILSKKSLIFVNSKSYKTKVKDTNLRDGDYSKELIFNSNIVTSTWLDFYIFVISLSNNQLLFFNFQNNTRHFLFIKTLNNYSKVTCLLYKNGFLFVSFTTKEIVCFKVNYSLLDLHAFKRTNSIEGNYLNVKYLFKKKKKRTLKNGKVKNGVNTLDAGLISKEVENNFEKNIKTNKKEKYKNAFNNILKDIEKLEHKLNTESSFILKNGEKTKWNGNTNIGSSDDTNLTLNELESEDNNNNNRWKDSDINRFEIEKSRKGVNNMNKENVCIYESENKKDKKKIYFNLKKKKKKMFFNLNYRSNKVTDILKYISIINLQKDIGSKIYSFFMHYNYIFILLDNGIIYYNKNYDEQNRGLYNISNFYYLTSICLHKITNIKINNNGNIFSLDKAHVLKYYSLKKSDLNIVHTNQKIIFFDVFPILQEYNCLFISLANGSFYFTNIDTKQILLYDEIENILKRKNRWKTNSVSKKYIEWAYFNKVNDNVLNGYLKIKNIFYFFYLIYSESHEKFFIYIIHKLNIYKILLNIIINNDVRKRKTDHTHGLTILNSSVYKTGEADYICFTISEQLDNKFYIVFVKLIGERDILEKKAKKNMNKDKEIKYYNSTIIYYLDIQNLNVVFSKVIGNYLVIVDKFLNITFYLLTESHFQNVSTHNAPTILGREKKETHKNEQKINKKYLTTRYKSYEDKVENFFLTRISKKKTKNNNIKRVETENVSEQVDKNDEDDKSTEIQTSIIDVVHINLGKESFRINIQNTFKIKFINEHINEEEKEICFIYIITDTNLLIKFSFNCMLDRLENIKNIHIKAYPYLASLDFFYSYNYKNEMHDFILNGGKYFHLEHFEKENASSESISILETNENTLAESNNVETCGSKQNENSIMQTNSTVNLQFYNKIMLEKKNYFYKNLSVVFFKICSAALHNKKQKRKKQKKFIDTIDVKIMKDEVKYKPLDFFFDDETIIFTFTNENDYNINLYECLENCKDKGYLDNLNKQEKEMTSQINKLRIKLKNLIKENKKNYNDMKLNREAFFFDKKYINEIEIIKNEYEQIKNYFEIEKKEKQNIINILNKKCNIFDKINFIHGFRKGLSVTSLYKMNETNKIEEINESPNKNRNIVYNIGTYAKFINKIKTLRFLQIKEMHYMQNVEKNNNLYYLKNPKNYIDEYLENLSSLFFVHYYSYKNININFLYSNLFNSTYKDNETQTLHWNYLLYYPYELFTSSRKKIQCFILCILIDQEKLKFYNKFTILKKEKENYFDEIKLLTIKLRQSIDEIKDYLEHSYSDKIDLKLFQHDIFEIVKTCYTDIINNNLDPKNILKDYLNKIKFRNNKKNQNCQHLFDNNNDTTTLKESTSNEFINQKKDDVSLNEDEPEHVQKISKATKNNEQELSEQLEYYNKKKEDIRNKLIDIKNYIYQINNQCNEFNEKLQLLRKQKANTYKQIMLHEFYCISIYSLLKNEDTKMKVLKKFENKQNKIQNNLKGISDLIATLKGKESCNKVLNQKKGDLILKYNKSLKLNESIIERKQNFEKKFLHECANFDVLMEQRYEHIIGFEYDSKKNIFLKKKVIQKHILDTNQLIQKINELQKNIKNVKKEIYKNKIKNDYFKFLIMDIDEEVNDVKYLKENCEFLFCDINNVISSLETKKRNKEAMFQLSEQKLRDKINNLNSKISSIKYENTVLGENIKSLIDEINEIKESRGDNNKILLDEELIQCLENDEKKKKNEKNITDIILWGPCDGFLKNLHTNYIDYNTKNISKKKGIRTKEIYEKSTLLKKFYK
ncbi:conserved Plasmodium protein, unknown function [Plasmodium chabaudi chabaudi]|uniref:Uncharacterized protein n=1 Tax=Plasmodium chabaudi chabaudi TaxID=31271 RepID=A0A4V0K2J5_PLACU|nr:conserved Plasmodium protein, unknown function [Plasmodium chabaudi chabaudi]VTZ67044.1 conserved Plasmodium protein, unknown function [Plasmodium chabaudi chabaudi]|eukprot:XP_016653207.1 conserved Plasmodium protein, unknown function [Plasmodium chabaudi chabaudi]